METSAVIVEAAETTNLLVLCRPCHVATFKPQISQRRKPGADAHRAAVDALWIDADDEQANAGGHTLEIGMQTGGVNAPRDGEDVRAHVEKQVRTAVGDEVAACERFGEFITSHTVPWPARALDDERADPIIVAEFGRARKTYAAALHLVLGGFGPQAAMLNRSLFEGMAVTHWAHANPKRAWELFQKHERHNELLWGDALTGVGWVEPGEMDSGTEEERAELGKLFGPYGHRLWTGHQNLREIVIDIDHLWPEGRNREELWEFFRVVHRDNNQVLHSSVTALMGGAQSEENAVVFDAVPSSFYLDRALLGAIWCCAQTVTLVWEHFRLAGREELDALIIDVRRPFVTVDPAVAKHTGRNDPCPCGSGMKYKRCHGA